MALWQSSSSDDGVPTHSSEQQYEVEEHCRALFEEWRDLDDTIHRES